MKTKMIGMNTCPQFYSHVKFGNYVLWFPRVISKHVPNFRDNGLGHTKSNIVLLVTIDKFDPNLVLVNINMLKPYKFIEDKTLQPILTKLSDLVLMNLFKQKNLNHYMLSMKIFNF
jgi:hypothetical protein